MPQPVMTVVSYVLIFAFGCVMGYVFGYADARNQSSVSRERWNK